MRSRSGSANLDMVGALDRVRTLGRLRRLRFQLPLGIAGVAIGVGSVLYSQILGWSLGGGFGIALGPWLLLFVVMPTDARAIAFALAVALALTVVVLFRVLGDFDAAREYGPGCLSSGACAAFYVGSVYAVIIMSGHALYYLYVAVGLLGSQQKVKWLPKRPPRAALLAMWRCIGSTFVSYCVHWFALAIVELTVPRPPRVVPIDQLHPPTRFEADWSPVERFCTRFFLGALLLTLGALSLWPGLRVFVQTRLSSCGEGVAAASAISELLGSRKTADIVALAERSFRVVRADKLAAHHLDTNEPAAEAFAVSTHAKIGSADVFLSHSWQDDSAEKWRLLQAWRADFVAAHGREPTLWLDRCCIDPGALQAQLPCLPIYLAGCDKLLALRGHTYLSRLWCVVELFVFREMKADSSRIDIVDFANVPPYTPDGMPVLPAKAKRTPSNMLAHARAGRISSGGWSAEGLALRHERFSVQRATCTMQSDTDSLLSTIEAVGSGFETFNDWMHELLCRPKGDGTAPRSGNPAPRRPPRAAQSASVHPSLPEEKTKRQRRCSILFSRST